MKAKPSFDDLPLVLAAEVQLTPVGRFRKGATYREKSNMVTRPYFPIDSIAFRLLECHRSKADIFEMSNGEKVTFGTADGGWALMPIALDQINNIHPLESP